MSPTNRLVVVISIVLAATAAIAADEPTTHHLMTALHGSWRGQGRLLGNDAKFSMEWGSAHGGAFTTLRFHNAIVRDGVADTVLTATAYYRATSADTLEGVWVDSRGLILPLHAVVDDSTLTTHWGSAATEQGKTTYRLQAAAVVVVRDSVLSRGVLREFGEARYELQH